MKKTLLLIIFIFSPLLAYAYDIDISADQLEYDQGADSADAQGHVRIMWEGKTLDADEVSFNFSQQSMTAHGNIVLEEDGNIIFADSVTYYYDAEKGELKKSKIASNAVFIQSENLERLDKENYLGSRTKISNCDLDEPHTSFRASSAKLRPGKRITLYNVVVFIGHLPVFYFPVLTRNLDRGREIFEVTVEPGYDKTAGFFVKTMLSYNLTENLKHSFFLDYIGDYGNGYGTLLSYLTDKTNATVYAYNIEDKIMGMRRWAIKPMIQSRLNRFWILRSQGEFMSDPDFNNIYNRSSWDRLSVRPHNYASLTRAGGSSTLLIVVEEYKSYNFTEQKYELYSQNLPQISYTHYPRMLFGNIANNFNIRYGHPGSKYSAQEFFFKNTISFEDVLSRSFNLTRIFTLTPSAGIAGTWTDKDNFAQQYYTTYINYIGGLNARLRVANWMDWNFFYLRRTISERNTFNVDMNRNDYGIITESLGYANHLYLGSNALIRNTVSYDLRKFKTPFYNRWSSLESELTYTPTTSLTFYVRHLQEIYPETKMQGLQSEIYIGDKERAFLRLGAFFQEPRKKELDNIFGFGLWLTPKWRLDCLIRTNWKVEGNEIEIIDREIRLYRDMHCYNVGITWRGRKDINEGTVEEYFFLFTLKTNMPFSRTNPQDADIFYPWR